MSATRSDVHPHIALNITRRCNQRCTFCFEGDRRDWEEMNLDQVKSLMTESAETHREMIFMGGEALLRPDILEVIRYGRELNLSLEAFTNGQVLARAGFVDELVESGLRAVQISFHYADSETFAVGTRTPGRLFTRLLQGLAQVREHNQRDPAHRLRVGVETDMAAFNLGRLSEIRKLLREHLGDSFTSHCLGTLIPSHSLSGEVFLEALGARREELIELLSQPSQGVNTRFSKTPLCLIPGYEHLSLDVENKLKLLETRSNFANKGKLGAMHAYQRNELENPYRWVCCRCNLLPICRTTRTSWYHDGYRPTRDQRPFPVTGVTPKEVVERLTLPDWRLREAERSIEAAHLSFAIPERTLLDAACQSNEPGMRMVEAYVDLRPLLDVEFDVDGERLALHLELVSRIPKTFCYLVQCLVAIPKVATSPERVHRALQLLARAPISPTGLWSELPGFERKSADHAMNLWCAFGTRLWPGNNFADGWQTVDAGPIADGYRLVVASPSRHATVFLLHPRPSAYAKPVVRFSWLDVGIQVDGTDQRGTVVQGLAASILGIVRTAADPKSARNNAAS